LASRLSARVLRKFGSPEGVFREPLPALESCQLPAAVAQAIVEKESFKRAEKELDGVRKIANCSLLNWTEPEYPQNLLQIYDPPVLLYVRGDPQVLNLPSLSIGTEKKLYELLSAEERRPIDDIVEHSGLNSSEVLATLFDLEMKGIIRQLPGKQFSKVLL
jgi:predicted Rossmann fold nucleotide-binding protein DprA/Smf involved in DNA uptake